MKTLFEITICWLVGAAVLLSPVFVLSGIAHAYPSGFCKSSDGYYKNVQFKVEESTDLTYAVEFQKAHKGQLITDADGEFFSVIWNDEIPAPATGYTCVKVEES